MNTIAVVIWISILLHFFISLHRDINYNFTSVLISKHPFSALLREKQSKIFVVILFWRWIGLKEGKRVLRRYIDIIVVVIWTFILLHFFISLHRDINYNFTSVLISKHLFSSLLKEKNRKSSWLSCSGGPSSFRLWSPLLSWGKNSGKSSWLILFWRGDESVEKGKAIHGYDSCSDFGFTFFYFFASLLKEKNRNLRRR